MTPMKKKDASAKPTPPLIIPIVQALILLNSLGYYAIQAAAPAVATTTMLSCLLPLLQPMRIIHDALSLFLFSRVASWNAFVLGNYEVAIHVFCVLLGYASMVLSTDQRDAFRLESSLWCGMMIFRVSKRMYKLGMHRHYYRFTIFVYTIRCSSPRVVYAWTHPTTTTASNDAMVELGYILVLLATTHGWYALCDKFPMIDTLSAFHKIGSYKFMNRCTKIWTNLNMHFAMSVGSTAIAIVVATMCDPPSNSDSIATTTTSVVAEYILSLCLAWVSIGFWKTFCGTSIARPYLRFERFRDAITDKRDGNTFISAHACFGIVLWVNNPLTKTLMMMMTQEANNNSSKQNNTSTITLIVVLILGLSVGVTRLLLGVHHVEDVLGGWTSGVAAMLLAQILVQQQQCHPVAYIIVAGLVALGVMYYDNSVTLSDLRLLRRKRKIFNGASLSVVGHMGPVRLAAQTLRRVRKYGHRTDCHVSQS